MAVAACAGGCGSASSEALRGRWNGTIVCAGDTSDITLSLQPDGKRFIGTGTTRTKGSNATWDLRGEQREEQREEECADDRCTTDKECVGRGPGGGNARCDVSRCTPCREKKPWTRILIKLVDDNVQLPDPELDLEREGDLKLVGTVRAFCPDEQVQTPRVSLRKE